MRRTRAHFLRELYLLRAPLPWNGEADLGIIPTVIKEVIIIIIAVVGRESFCLKCCLCIGHDLRVLAPALADRDQIGFGEAFIGLGPRDQLVDDARLGKIGITADF